MQEQTTTPRSSLRQPAFIVVLMILLAAAVGLEGATNFMKLHFRKLPVPLARSLSEIPKNLGPWYQISVDQPLQHDIKESLATDDYVFRTFADTRVIGVERAESLPEEMVEFREKAIEYNEALKKYKESKGRTPQPVAPENPLATLRARHPTAFVDLGATYYTGLVDTVAHIPERCYVADGFDPAVTADLKWSALEAYPGAGTVRYVTFEDTTPERNSVRRNVAYVFQCNGQYISDSIAVRKRLANLRERYGYYMKVELQTFNLSEPEAGRVMNDFLSNLLPESEKCLADWSALTSAR